MGVGVRARGDDTAIGHAVGRKSEYALAVVGNREGRDAQCRFAFKIMVGGRGGMTGVAGIRTAMLKEANATQLWASVTLTDS